MSSDRKGVQAEIAKYAPDAEYQGCCLHSINLVICHACKIKLIQNMMDSCHELFSFFDNSPKRQKFLTIVIDALSPETKKRRLKDLCKTRWIERHSTFETIFDLYEYIVITLNEICVPTNDDVRFYPNNEEWSWDAKTKTMANGLRHSMISFGHIVSFICAKEMLEPMRPLVTALQGRLVEVYFGFQKIEEVIKSYAEIRSAIDSWFQRMYQKAVTLSELVGSTEERPRVCGRQRNRENHPAESDIQHWKRTVATPFLDVICSELKSRFSKEKRAHYELCALIPQVITSKSEEATVEVGQVLHEKWGHLMPLPSSFESELFRWMNHWKRQAVSDYESISVSSLLANHADDIFFPNVRELLKDLAILPMGSTEAERSFSCIRRIHTWLRNTMTTKRLSDLAVIGMHANTVAIDRRLVCEKFVAQHPRRMTASSLLAD